MSSSGDVCQSSHITGESRREVVCGNESVLWSTPFCVCGCIKHNVYRSYDLGKLYERDMNMDFSVYQNFKIAVFTVTERYLKLYQYNMKTGIKWC